MNIVHISEKWNAFLKTPLNQLGTRFYPIERSVSEKSWADRAQ